MKNIRVYIFLILILTAFGIEANDESLQYMAEIFHQPQNASFGFGRSGGKYHFTDPEGRYSPGDVRDLAFNTGQNKILANFIP